MVVPARNEATLVRRCVQSIAVARTEVLHRCRVDIVVVADRCTDHTVHAATTALDGIGTVMVADVGSAGAARALGCSAALDTRSHPLSLTWIANTDADTSVPRGWFADQLRWADAGVTAVAGVVDIAPNDPRLRRLFADTYALHPDGTHPHVHGANLGVRADAYVGVGGWGDVQTGEDHDLWNRLRAGGYRTVSDSALTVMTSARRSGRAPKGFARNIDVLARQLSLVGE